MALWAVYSGVPQWVVCVEVPCQNASCWEPGVCHGSLEGGFVAGVWLL